MIIIRKDPVTGKTNSRDIPVNEQALREWSEGKGLIQNLMPHLSPDEREFIMTGIMADSWDELFKHIKEEEGNEIDPESAF